MIKKQIIFLFLFINLCASEDSLNKIINQKYGCLCPGPRFVCTNNTLAQVYPNQNMCKLLNEVPKALKDLPYVILTTNRSYDTQRFNYNKRFNFFPRAIIKPNNTSQVAQALKILRDNNLNFSLRSGGHCFGPGSLSPDYVFDLANFNTIVPNYKTKEVFIGAGCRLGCVIETLGKKDFLIPTGDCGSNGITGLALGGGVGILARKFGLTCDSIKSIILVDANSQVIEVDKDNKPDLFWALRGAGGGSYGIVLGFVFKMYFVPKVSLLIMNFDWNETEVDQVVQAWQSWIQTLPNEITSYLDFQYINGRINFKIISLKVGDQPFTEWENTFERFNPNVTLQMVRYIDAAKMFAGTSTFPFLKAKSKMLFDPLSSEAIQIIFNYLESLRVANADFSVRFQIYSAGGKSAQGNTAYFPRNALAWFFQFAYWNFQHQDQEALSSIKSFYEAISPFCSPFSYANLVDYDIGPDYLNIYYGNHVNRLVRIKNKYDPTNIFHWKQSIPLNA